MNNLHPIMRQVLRGIVPDNLLDDVVAAHSTAAPLRLHGGVEETGGGTCALLVPDAGHLHEHAREVAARPTKAFQITTFEQAVKYARELIGTDICLEKFFIDRADDEAGHATMPDERDAEYWSFYDAAIRVVMKRLGI